jgi:hypothetical protein
MKIDIDMNKHIPVLWATKSASVNILGIYKSDTNFSAKIPILKM